MRARVVIAAIAIGASAWLAANVNAGQAPSDAPSFTVPGATYTPPKTPWGDPDLQGVWDYHTVVPMQRPANLAGKRMFTEVELAARAKARASNEPLCNQNDERCAKATVADLDILSKRTKRRGERPLVDKMKELLPLREPIYALSDIVVQSRDEPHETIVDEIVAALPKHLKIIVGGGNQS